eukprot:1161225-Pelagomonas_calceolata.AAC.11
MGLHGGRRSKEKVYRGAGRGLPTYSTGAQLHLQINGDCKPSGDCKPHTSCQQIKPSSASSKEKCSRQRSTHEKERKNDLLAVLPRALRKEPPNDSH